MNMMKKIYLVVGLVLCVQHGHAVETKKAEDVFKKWLEWQQIMPDMSIASMSSELNDAFISNFKSLYEKNLTTLRSLNPVLSVIMNQNITDRGYTLRNQIDPVSKENLTQLFSSFDNNMPGFINFMRSSPLVNADDAANAHETTSSTEKYNTFFQLLFAHPDQMVASKYLFTLGNRFFEFCFGERSFPEFQKLLLDKPSYPVNRMIYATTWYNLAGNGWKNWSEESLKNLKAKADQGDQIVYIAGGSDVYQMIEKGIYNIKNIDPQLPSQPKYYADGWEYILHGAAPEYGIGDKIVFNFADDRVITMERIGFKTHGTTFKARLANNETIEIPHSTTLWKLSDKEGNVIGQYVLERRFCQQSDFESAPRKTLLLSFNELYFVTLPDFLGGWGISPCKFPQDFSVIVKQLHKPVSRQIAVNMHIASLLNSSDFRYIALGTCIN